MMVERTIRLLDFTFRCHLRYEDTARYFKTVPPNLAAAPTAEISVLEQDWKEIWAEGFSDCAHTEYSVLTSYFSDALLRQECVIVHAVAIRWRDRAYLICADSGVGKSTQARILRELRPGEFGIICGDRPILDFREEASVLVHPSPWNGKEDWKGADAAPLAGLIILERGETNRLVSLSEREIALQMYTYFIQTAWEKENICRVANLETCLLRQVPIWKLTTHSVPDSTRLLLESVFCY